MTRQDLRNIAIIAHVDHGKTTLVDGMLRTAGVFRENEQVAERVMDSGDLERERGITILAKNAGAIYKGVKINLIDTPGHADFGGEVERVLKMVSGVLLLVDAAEGPMPQTRFVLQKALSQDLSVIIVVNKIDRPDARIKEVVDEILLLLMDLGATDRQLDSPTVFCSGRNGTASYSPDVEGTDLVPLLDSILEYTTPPQGDKDAPFSMIVSSIEYNEYVGRIAVGRIESGTLRTGDRLELCDYHDRDLQIKGKVSALFTYEGVSRVQCSEASAGDIVALSGIEEVNIGNTLTGGDGIEPLPFLKINEPTVEMTFAVNNSPYAGREGKFVTSRQIKDRLQKELLRDVALRVSDGERADSFKVLGRGEMHLSILIETMRREGFEFSVSPPRVLYRDNDGNRQEPFEYVVIDVPQDCVGSVMEKLPARKGELLQMMPVGSRTRLEFRIPARGLFGYRSEFLTDTKGEGILNTLFDGYDDYKGDLSTNERGSLIAHETGESVTYGLYNAEERGTLFIGPGVPVYAGMVVGVSPKSEDMTVNVCKRKQMTNIRASGSDDSLRLTPARNMSLEECLEFLKADELLEVTPKSLRIRKQILDHNLRMRANKS